MPTHVACKGLQIFHSILTGIQFKRSAEPDAQVITDATEVVDAIVEIWLEKHVKGIVSLKHDSLKRNMNNLSYNLTLNDPEGTILNVLAAVHTALYKMGSQGILKGETGHRALIQQVLPRL